MNEKVANTLVAKDSYSIVIPSRTTISTEGTIALLNHKLYELGELISKHDQEAILTELQKMKHKEEYSVEEFWTILNSLDGIKIKTFILTDFKKASDLAVKKVGFIAFVSEKFKLTRTEIDEAFVAYDISGALEGSITAQFDNSSFTGGIHYQNDPYVTDEDDNTEEVDVEWSELTNDDLYDEVARYAVSDYNEIQLGL